MRVRFGIRTPRRIARKSRKRKKDTGGLEGDGSEPPRTLSAYNVFMKTEVAKVKGEHPSLPHREAFKLAAERWQASPMNPQNGGERFPLAAGDAAPGVVGAASGVPGAPEPVAEAVGASTIGGDASCSADPAAVAGLGGAMYAEGDAGAMAAVGGDGEEDGEEDDEEEDGDEAA